PGEDFFLQRFGLLVRTVDHLFTYSSDQATVGCVKLLSQQPDIRRHFIIRRCSVEKRCTIAGFSIGLTFKRLLSADARAKKPTPTAELALAFAILLL
ncbi:hypothetical protein, partial [Cohnella sp. GCM10012308]|uniref:hypothetical protein n=1 Tax=Cohnella sp. GCM10012308 TaxID=3317329 RepID=UPI00361CB10A